MPLFGHKHEQTVPATAPPPARTSVDSHSSGGLFSKHRHSTSTSSETGSRVAASPTHTTSSTSSGLGSIFHRGHGEDPGISAARQRVIAAEQAERQADAALAQARTAVKDARAHVKQLELDAEEEARLAKIKQGQARDLGKRAQPLGRHGA